MPKRCINWHPRRLPSTGLSWKPSRSSILIRPASSISTRQMLLTPKVSRSSPNRSSFAGACETRSNSAPWSISAIRISTPNASCWRSIATPNTPAWNRNTRWRPAVRRSVPRSPGSARRATRKPRRRSSSRARRWRWRGLRRSALSEARIRTEEEAQRREIARRRALDEAELKMRELTEREQIALGFELEKARIERERAQSELEIARRRALEIVELERQIAIAEKTLELTRAEAEKRRAEIIANQTIEAERIQQERAIDEVRLGRERHLNSLQISNRQALEEAEIAAAEEIERTRIATERGLEEARLVKNRDLRQLAIDCEVKVELAEIQKAIELARGTQERSAALVAAEAARAEAVAAEERTITVREREVAERRKLMELIATEREVQQEALRVIAAAEAEMQAARSLAEARKVTAAAEAEAEKTRVAAAAQRYEIEAEGQRLINEAENLLSSEARAGRLRDKLLDRLEGIVRESVKPLEKIDGIKILHVDGLNGGGRAGGSRNVTDEVIDSALRYRVQAPMIDNLMKEIGIEGGSLGRLTDVLRDAKDISSLTRDKTQLGKDGLKHDEREDERERDR